MRILLALLMMTSVNVFGASLDDIEYPDQIKVGDKSLELNGLGMRKKDKFGLTFKVYVGALYVTKKTQSADEIMKSNDLKVLKFTFVRRVDGPAVAEGFVEGFDKNCSVNCEATKKELLKITNNMPEIMNKGTMEFQIFPDKVEYDIKGRKDLKGTLPGADISKNFLAIFMGSKPPTEELKNGMLGIKK